MLKNASDLILLSVKVNKMPRLCDLIIKTRDPEPGVFQFNRLL
jgi:hypothetical protein